MAWTPLHPLSSRHSKRMEEGTDLAALRCRSGRAAQKEHWTGSQRLGSGSETYCSPIPTHLGPSFLAHEREEELMSTSEGSPGSWELEPQEGD